ncbi:PHD finger protein MALE MEIOCYTE DEATH 1-like [Selaginella moellendorffii]|uniref:PHD finger protein MALE MEIOCYTE DEATH 1-like n=1 Tax=Selaginella moellendorffii TaxID=88036 RepID=UPI000D1CE2E3|nr:PHD finger protein MALE MEIOCYTE DEATH 1-like [Selaginella moellendorffii]|eukprot:XP_024528151.1 PHD finger protein MALE MEIOCYTE DEATH 1-like [Selaginella moellendorffii]
MVLYRPPKRARVVERFSLERFGSGGYPADFSGPFRSNVRAFLNEFGQMMAAPMPGVQRWCVPLVSQRGAEQSLLVLEELPFESGALGCSHCRIIGWSHHPVCGARYHFILHAPGKLEALGNTSHLLHGIIHSNGYGHLLRVNGFEGGSSSLSGREIMNLWDRLCTMMRARKVSVLDASKKFGTSFRLLHAVAKGQPWYGLWGYQFGRGSFGITDAAYKKAVNQIASTPLSFFLDLGDERLRRIATYYRNGRTGNLQELVSHFMELLHALSSKATGSKATVPAGVNAPPAPAPAPNRNSQRWSAKRLDKTLDVLLTALRQFGLNEWMPRIKLREQARLHIGDTGLLDHSLCSFVGKIVGDLVVQRRRDEQFRQLEYRLARIESPEIQDKKEEADAPEFSKVLDDLRYLYSKVLAGGLLPEDDPLAQASRTVLDTKHFIKDYNGNSETDPCDEPGAEVFRVQCRMESVEQGGDQGGAPSELVVLPASATVGDLKREAAKAFRDVYPSLGQLRVTSIPVLEGEADERPLKLVKIQRTAEVAIRATGIDNRFSAGRFEKGVDDWVVNCRCGARDDDGERMAACDSCGVWSHTRCAHIRDGDDVPEQFFCGGCT